MGKRFRKRPIKVEAMQWDGGMTSILEIDDWIGRPPNDRVVNWRASEERGVENVTIGTLDGDLHLSAGDWIVRTERGTYYPYKPDSFEQIYEPVDG